MTAFVDTGELPVTYTVDGLTFGRYDDNGCWWVPQKTEGWHEPAEARDSTEARTGGHGSFSVATYFDERDIVISGIVICPDVGARLKARTRFNGLCADPGSLYEFLAVDQAGERMTARAKRAGKAKFELKGECLADFQLTLVAPDPRKHAAAWQDPIANPPGPTIGGVNFGTSGASFAGAGLSFGTAADPSTTCQVANYGTAPAFPLFSLTGPLNQPVVYHVESGRTIRYSGDIAAGETVRVNCDEFAARQVPGHGRVSSTRGNVASLFTIGTEWPVVAPQAAASFQLRGGGSTSAQLMASLRSAWW